MYSSEGKKNNYIILEIEFSTSNPILIRNTPKMPTGIFVLQTGILNSPKMPTGIFVLQTGKYGCLNTPKMPTGVFVLQTGDSLSPLSFESF